MGKSITEIPKKRGRPATGKDPLITMRLPEGMIAAVDGYAAKRKLSRSGAIRQMIELGLKQKATIKEKP